MYSREVFVRTEVEADRGAPNVDSRCTGPAMRDYLRVSDLERLPHDVIAPYDAGVSEELAFAVYER